MIALSRSNHSRVMLDDRVAFEAQYPGPCSDCPYPIKVGEMIVMAWSEEDDHAYWKHQKCPVEKPTKFQGITSEDMGF